MSETRTAPEHDDPPLPLPALRILLAHHRRAERGAETDYNLPQLIRLDGPLDVARLSATLEQLIARHDALHSQIVAKGGAWRLQTITPPPLSLRAEPIARGEARARFQAFIQPFDLATAPLSRIGLLRETPTRHWLMWDFHHALVDGVSLGQIFGEIGAGYAGQSIPAPRLTYADFCRDATREIAPPLSPPPSPIPWLIAPSPRAGIFVEALDLDAARLAHLKASSARLGVRFTAVLLEGLGRLLRRLTGVEAPTIGVVTAGRARARFEGVVGCFIEVIPARIPTSVGRVEATLAADAALTEGLNRPVGAGLYDVVLINQGFLGRAGLRLDGRARREGLALTPTIIRTGLMGATLAVELLPTATGARLRAELSGRLPPSLRARLLPLLVALLEAEEDTARWPTTLPRALTAAPALDGGDLIEALRGSARRHPARVALVTAAGRLTYAALFEAAEEIAEALRAFDPPSVILEVEAPVDRVALALGAALARIPFMFIEDHLPEGRKAHLRALHPGGLRLETRASSSWSRLPGEGVRHPGILALLFTSGSTGAPKAVRLRAEAALRYARAFTQRVGVTPDDALATPASFMVDIALEALLGALLNGAALYPIPRALALDGQATAAALRREEITLLTATPSWLEACVAAGGTLTGLTIISGGAPLQRRLAVEGLAGCRVFNTYGPTEATIACLAHEVSEADPERLPLGRPLPGYQIVIAAEGEAQPVGVGGELHIGGPQLSAGYTTPEGLAPLNLVTIRGVEGALYPTGDLAWMDLDGVIHFAGRRDRQVKRAGWRVELAEVERVLAARPDVLAARVEVVEGALHAWITPKGAFDLEATRAALRHHLPPQMRPSALFVNGARAAEGGASAIPEALRPRLEALLPRFAEALGAEIGPHTDLFEAGGDSLSAMQLYAALSAEWDLEINDLFEHPTPLGIAARLRPKATGAELEARLRAMLEVPTPSSPSHAPVNFTPSTPLQRRAILLTGATGDVGIHLLRALIEETTTRVYVGVRGGVEAGGARLAAIFEARFDAPLDMERVTLLDYDLTAPLLGLGEAGFTALARACDGILHAAASIKLVGPLDAALAINHAGTEAILGLLARNPKADLCYISTTALDHLDGAPHNPYLISKARAEAAVMAARQQGAWASIYRVGNVAFDAATGRTRHDIEASAFYRFLRAALATGALFDGHRPLFNFTYADQLARGLLRLWHQPTLLGRDFTLSNPHDLSPRQLREGLTRAGYSLEGLTPAAFVEVWARQPATRRGDLALAAHALALMVAVSQPAFPNARSWLKALDAPFSPPTAAHLRRMVDHCVARGFFEAPA
ncbi:AMP-binding protein [Myxococcota bacterium]|nr:AMP-binding protein [Myxococcota bacterium]